ncbi:patatin-like phospholipase family protein [Zunongwangia sp. SCSIO 43204]|uniref:patatin-like phospholipase family protein n=1 Tax=Zunongwangia sp. SCSIO 43204 TaxID=2779359 RepID=UPI001CA96F1D|nr:patatin-like phospholipase family protein [Zunongwangia sp. SCSIO 43204]UAB85403.1 patatin-like phospholipase family protein [Zunongwangia sp. SCSIO 43204]
MKKIFCILFFCSSLFSFSQEEKLKVGLVLSGGGAKGLAHIGAIKAIEEAGVHIDYIAGTSMGAIVGGLYASGYTATELDSIVNHTNFNILIQDEIPRKSMTFYEKENTERYALTLPFDHFKVGFPSGLSKGQNIYNFMSGLTVHLEDETDFTQLPIPFFCVAANVETGEEIILDKGSLAKSVAASGAIPSLFSPVKIDGRLLIDGGVVNNYPVEELRRRGADVVIGVDVQDSLLNRKDLKGVFDIFTQVSNFRTINDMKHKIPLTDIYIRPDIGRFSIMSFEEGSAIIDSGKVAGNERISALKELASKQQTHPKPYKRKLIDTLNLSRVELAGNTNYPRSFIMGRLRLQTPGKFSLSQINEGIDFLSATGNFDKINYFLTQDNEDSYTLNLNMDESENKTFLKLALHYDELYRSAALVNLTRKSSIFTNDVTSLDLIVGENVRYNFQYYIDKGYYWSIGVKSRFNSFDTPVDYALVEDEINGSDFNINRIDIDFKDFTNQFYVETLFKQVASLGMGAEHKYLKISSETINSGEEGLDVPGTEFENNHYYSAFGYLKYDSFDNKYYPKRGFYFHGDFHIYPFSSIDDFTEFSIAKGKIGYVFTPIRNLSFRLFSETGFKIGPSDQRTLDFLLGGYGNNLINNMVPFYGYDFISLGGDSYIKGLVEADVEIFKNNHITLSGNIANVENDLYSSGNWLSLPDYTGYALGYGMETFLGPMEVKYSYSPEIRESQWFFSLGFWF